MVENFKVITRLVVIMQRIILLIVILAFKLFQDVPEGYKRISEEFPTGFREILGSFRDHRFSGELQRGTREVSDAFHGVSGHFRAF